MHDYLVTSCAFSNQDAKHVVSVSDVDYLIHIWDTETGKLVDTISDIHTSTITSCQFSPGNDRIVTTSMDRTTKFYDTSARSVTINLGSHNNVISNCAFTPQERTFATCSWDKSINVWDISTGMYRKDGPSNLCKGGHEGSVSSCFLSADGSLCVSGGYDCRLVLWDLDHGTAKLALRVNSNKIE
jgi:WD40 repeat protein